MRKLSTAFLIALIFAFAGTGNTQLALNEEHQGQMVLTNLSSMPIAFTENRGQWGEKTLFKAEARGATFYFCRDEVAYLFVRDTNELLEEEFFPGNAPRGLDDRYSRSHFKKEAMLIKAQFVDANPYSEIIGEDRLSHNCNYFYGNDPSKWRTDVPNYSAMVYRDLWPGIDLRYHGDGRGMKYDFIVNPGADVSQIRIRYEEVDGLSLTNQGDLQVRTTFGLVYEKIPSIYQEIAGQRIDVAGQYILIEPGVFGFQVQDYNFSIPLVIDPELVYSTYLGGGSIDRGYSIAVDGSGSAYVTGITSSSNFPTVNPYDGSLNGDNDAFLAKLSAPGNSLVYSTYLGGGGGEYSFDIAVDGSGSAYVTGWTTSSDFPTVNPYNGNHNGLIDVFVVKISTSGSFLVYSTFLGGSAHNKGYGIAVDGSGSAYVTGWTISSDFPTVNAYDDSFNGGDDIFVTKLSATGNSLVYSTYLGGSYSDWYSEIGWDIAVDGSGSAYVTGRTSSSDFPTVNAYDGSYNGEEEAFLAKFSASGSSIVYSTYLGGYSRDYGYSIAVDGSGSAYVTGRTSSSDFPTVNAYDGSYNGEEEAFLAKFSASGSSIVYSTYLGGYSRDYGYSIAVDGSGSAYVTGRTSSSDFPTVNAYDGSYNGGDAFVTKFSVSGSSLIYSTYLGGNDSENGDCIAVDSGGNAYITGTTFSTDFPTQNPYQTDQPEDDAFVAKFGSSGGSRLTINIPIIVTPNPPIHAENSIISVTIRNAGDQIWETRPLILSVEVQDLKHDGPGDSFWLLLSDHPGQVRQHRFVPFNIPGDLAPDETETIDISFKFNAPDFSDKLFLELRSASEGGLIDDQQISTTANTYPFMVDFNSSTYVNCFGELLTGLTHGVVDKTYACYIELAWNIIYDYGYRGIYGNEYEGALAQLTDPNNDLGDYVQIGSDLMQLTTETADYATQIILNNNLCGGSTPFGNLNVFLSFIIAMYDEFTGNGCGAVIVHEKLRTRNLILGMAEQLEGLPELGLRYLVFMVACPAELQVVSASGDTAYVHLDGSVTNNIDDGFAFQAGDSCRVIFAPNNSSYDMRVFGSDNGVANIAILQPSDSITANAIFYDSLAITTTSVQALQIDSATTNYSLLIDMEGDGIFEDSLLPDSVVVITPAGVCDYVTGDVNGSLAYNGLDVTYGVNYLKGGPEPMYECECTEGNTWFVSGDVNGSCSYNGLDITYGVSYLKGIQTELIPCPDCPPIE
jgi:hypothetical protein